MFDSLNQVGPRVGGEREGGGEREEEEERGGEKGREGGRFVILSSNILLLFHVVIVSYFFTQHSIGLPDVHSGYGFAIGKLLVLCIMSCV